MPSYLFSTSKIKTLFYTINYYVVFLIYTVFCTVSSCSATAAGYYPDDSGFNTSVLYFNPNLLGFNLKVQGFNPQLSCFNPDVLYFNPNLWGFNPKGWGFNPRLSCFNPEVLYFSPNLWGFNLKVRGLNPQLSGLVFVHLGGVIAASGFIHFHCFIQ